MSRFSSIRHMQGGVAPNRPMIPKSSNRATVSNRNFLLTLPPCESDSLSRMHINSGRVNLAAATLAATLFIAPVFAAAPPLKPLHLLCDSLDRPLGIDSPQPLLSWQLQDAGFGARQTAYRIEVASTPTLLSGDKPDVWDSGRIA